MAANLSVNATAKTTRTNNRKDHYAGIFHSTIEPKKSRYNFNLSKRKPNAGKAKFSNYHNINNTYVPTVPKASNMPNTLSWGGKRIRQKKRHTRKRNVKH